MSITDLIKKDREAGTPDEKWYAAQPEHCHGWWVVSRDEAGDNAIDESGDGGFNPETAARIARVPELEEIALAADAMANAETAAEQSVRYWKLKALLSK